MKSLLKMATNHKWNILDFKRVFYMDANLKNAFANVQLEGYDFSTEQVIFITSLVERINSREITWNEAIEIIKERHLQRQNE